MQIKKKIVKIFSLFSFSLLPLFSFAAPINSNATVSDIITWAHSLITAFIIPFLFALATAVFIWGVFSYYLNPDNEDKKKKGKEYIMGGLIALFVMLSVWGIVSIFTNTFNLDNKIPQIQGNFSGTSRTIINNDGTIIQN